MRFPWCFTPFIDGPELISESNSIHITSTLVKRNGTIESIIVKKFSSLDYQGRTKIALSVTSTIGETSYSRVFKTSNSPYIPSYSKDESGAVVEFKPYIHSSVGTSQVFRRNSKTLLCIKKTNSEGSWGGSSTKWVMEDDKDFKNYSHFVKMNPLSFSTQEQHEQLIRFR